MTRPYFPPLSAVAYLRRAEETANESFKRKHPLAGKKYRRGPSGDQPNSAPDKENHQKPDPEETTP